MKKIIVTLLLISFVSKSCFATNNFDYGIDKTTDINFNNTIITEGNSEQPSNFITFDFVPLFNRTVVVPTKKQVSALVRSFCNMCSNGYDLTKLILKTTCGDNSNYSFTIEAGDESLTTDSVNGSVVAGIPDGEFSAQINNNEDVDLSCETYLLGVGLDITPEEGYNINLTCYDKLPDGEKTNIWPWLGPVIGVVGAALVGFGGYAGVQKARGNDILPEA